MSRKPTRAASLQQATPGLHQHSGTGPVQTQVNTSPGSSATLQSRTHARPPQAAAELLGEARQPAREIAAISPAPQPPPRRPPCPAPPAGALGAALRTSGSRRACFRCPPSSSSRRRRDAAAVAVALLGPGAGPLGAHPPAGTARRGPPAGRARGGRPRRLGERARRRQGHRDAPGSAPPPLRGGSAAGGAALVLSPGRAGAGWAVRGGGGAVTEGAVGSAAPLGSSLLAAALVQELQMGC